MNTFGARMAFDNAVKMLTAAGINPQTAVLTQSSLRLEQAANIATTQYRFPVLNNDSNGGTPQFATEQRLVLQDAFVISEMGLFLAVPSSAADTTFVLYSYPSPIIFPLGKATLGVVYNAGISISVNNQIILPYWDTLRYRFVPETQDTANATPSIDQFDGNEQGFYPVEPNIILSGSKNNVIQLNLPAAISAIDANTRLVLVMRGVRAQNSTSVN